MKVAIIGSHSLNKTTLCYEIAAKLKLEGLHVGLLEETVRDCPYPVNEQATEKGQEWIFHTQISREIEQEHKYPIVICDRSLLDNYMYTVQLFGRKEYLESQVKEYMKSYDLVIWVPLWQQPKGDGFRSTDRQFQLDIHELFRAYLPYFEVKAFTLCKNCREQWAETIVEEIKKRLANE